jgi:succinate dehydrogenase / fumarate reductase membrane anchor subunit
MVTRRQAVGAHYGLKDWLLQRMTAVLMAAYTVLLLAITLWNGGFDYGLWKALFGHAAFRAATFLFMVALLYHAWVGVRDIFMDYIKPVGMRLALQAAAATVLILYLGWTIQLLWGIKA